MNNEYNDGGELTYLRDFARKNLTILRDALIANELPFNMAWYFATHTGGGVRLTMDDFEQLKAAQGQDVNVCGTTACAVGWAPLFIETDPEDFKINPYTGKKEMHYGDFSEKYLISGLTSWWDWCFASAWDEIDNTREGAAYRINVLLETPQLYLEEGPPYDLTDGPHDVNEEAYHIAKNNWLNSLENKA